MDEIENRCPVTGVAATRMTEAGFARTCERKRASMHEDDWRMARCSWCKGKREHWPEELAVIKLEELNMAKKDGGRCVICDAKTELKNARGSMMVCPTCHKIVGYVDNHMARIVEAAKGLGKEAELAEALGAAMGAAADPADHAIAEAVRECFGRELTVEQLGARCREEAEKAARIEGELAQMREYADEAMRALAAVLPHEDEGLDDTRSYADLPDLAERAMMKMTGDNAELYELRKILKPDEPEETLIRAAERVVKAAREVPDTLTTLDEELDKARSTIAEQEKIIAELAGEIDRANVALPAFNPVDDALLKWARERLENGDLSLRVEEAAA